MAQRSHIALFGLTVAFVVSGASFAFGPRTFPSDPALLSATERLLIGLGDMLRGLGQPVDLPLMQLRPQGAYLLLLLAIWGLLPLESLSQIIDPAEKTPPGLMVAQTGALGFGAVWPWLILPAPVLAAIGAGAAAAFAILAAFRAKGQLRPGIGVLAGWATMAAVAMLAALVGQTFDLTLPATTVLAVIGGTTMAAMISVQLDGAVAYPLTIIGWLSALIITMLGASTSVTLTATVAITVMALALVRSVT